MTWNPLDWTAEPFLAFYVFCAAVVFLLGFWSRSMIGPSTLGPAKLGVLELAYLAGGARRLGDAALLSLTSGNGATIGAAGGDIAVSDPSPLTALMNRPPRLSFQPRMTRQQFQAAVKPVVEAVQERLQTLGYAPTDQQMMSFRMTVLPFVLFLLALGIAKAIVGSERGHPIGILIFLLVVTAVAGFALAARPTRTQAGGDALQRYRTSQARASRAPLEHELLLAVALSGPIVLSGTAYAAVYAASKTMSDGGGDGGGGCGGGGGGCGGCS
jgi:uncharacterized protein (TIGR04222 family)